MTPVRPEPLSLSPAGTGDAGEFAALYARCFPVPWTIETMRELLALDGAFARLARLGDSVCGYVLARITGEEAEILSLGVLPETRKRGVGRELLSAALGLAAIGGCRVVFLEVAEGNQAARQLYSRSGFHQVGRRRNYYQCPGQPPEAALVLRRDLRA
jgi:[ribosomal protein S18]-alanine N-acetyltransferase